MGGAGVIEVSVLTMKVSVEHLYHFNCDRCQKWWSIGDFPWGSQSSLWCPWCGHENELPEQPLTSKDFAAQQIVVDKNKPGSFPLGDLKELRHRWGVDKPPVVPGQIYRHHKHDPAADKWHEYEVICLVDAGPGLQDSPAYFTAVHASTQHWHDILPATGSPTATSDDTRHWAFPEVDERHVAYRNTQRSEEVWLRLLNEFIDGRFTLVP